MTELKEFLLRALRMIGRGLFLIRSPVFYPLDFVVWGYLKENNTQILKG